MAERDTMKTRTQRKHTYIISSIRANRRNDEYRNELYSDHEYSGGEWIVLDGLAWMVEEIIK